MTAGRVFYSVMAATISIIIQYYSMPVMARVKRNR